MIEIRPAEPQDVQAVAILIDELDRFYSAVDVEPSDLRVPQIATSLFQEPRAAHVLLAWAGTRPVGMATYSFLWPAAGVTRSLYLKEIFVTQAFRRKGVGTSLMREVCQIAVEHACSRIEWIANAGSILAEAFYDRLGAPISQEKIPYRLEGDNLRRMATIPKSPSV